MKEKKSLLVPGVSTYEALLSGITQKPGHDAMPGLRIYGIL